MGRQPCCDKVGLKKGPWTSDEDKKLINFILTNGQCCWRAVPKLAGLSSILHFNFNLLFTFSSSNICLCIFYINSVISTRLLQHTYHVYQRLYGHTGIALVYACWLLLMNIINHTVLFFCVLIWLKSNNVNKYVCG